MSTHKLPLTVEITERRAIPVRALPFVTQGTLAPVDLVQLFYDPESFVGSDGEGPVQAYSISGTSVEICTAGSWNIPRQRLAALQGTAQHDAGLVFIPASTFVWHDEFFAYYVSLAGMQADKEARGSQPAPFGELGWDENEWCPDDIRKLIFTGFEAFADSADGVPSEQPQGKRLSNMKQWDHGLQDLIEEKHESLSPQRQKVTTKIQLCEMVARDRKMKASTIMRRVRKVGTPRGM